MIERKSDVREIGHLQNGTTSTLFAQLSSALKRALRGC